MPLIVGMLTLAGTLATVFVTAKYQQSNVDKQNQSNERAKENELESNERLKRWELLNERARYPLPSLSGATQQHKYGAYTYQ